MSKKSAGSPSSRKSSTRIGRRTFLGSLGSTGAAVALGTGGLALTQATAAASEPVSPGTGSRRAQALKVRKDSAMLAFHRPVPHQTPNGEEHDYPHIANFTKGLPHDALGEVDPHAYESLLAALSSEDALAFETIPLGGVRKLRNPQAGLAFDLEGPDCIAVALRAAPRIDGPENSAEAAELYWMALARDVPFTQYDTDPTVGAASYDLSGFSDFRGPKQSGAVRPATLFRGNTPGDLTGPYVSQFLLKDIPYGTLTISQRQRTVLPSLDFTTGYADWLSVQNGLNPSVSDAFDPTARYIRNGRDLTAYVHFDALYEAYLNACLILLGLGAPFDAGNPYESYRKTDAFGTFGGPHILTLVTEAATRALKAVWNQKWYVHRRLRPEEFGGRVHNHVTGAASYPIDGEILSSPVLSEIHSRFGSYLLPQAFPEGSPLHPSYGSGHATVGGACVTILKAWFDESFVLPSPVVPDADGTSLVPYTAPGAGSLTVGGELNKVASNIASGRNFSGIHWRTDFTEAIKLGETIAIGILEEQQPTYLEGGSFTLTKFDGTRVTIGGTPVSHRL